MFECCLTGFGIEEFLKYNLAKAKVELKTIVRQY